MDRDRQNGIYAIPTEQELAETRRILAEERARNASVGDMAKGLAQNIYGLRNLGLFHDIIPAAFQSAKQAGTLPGRAYLGQVPRDQMIPEALNFGSFLTLGAGAIPSQANTLRSGFHGVRAKTVDPHAVMKAIDMERKGAGPQEIEFATGYFAGPSEIGPDFPGKWRTFNYDPDFELRDLPDEVGKPYPLKQFANVRGFSENYPKLSDRLQIMRMDEPGGGFDPNSGIISIGDLSDDYFQKQGGGTATLAHELQHAVQHAENFATGSNPDFISQIISDAKSRYGLPSLLSNLKKSASDSYRQLFNIPPTVRYDHPYFEANPTFVNTVLKAPGSEDVRRDMFDYPSQYSRMFYYATPGEREARRAAFLHFNPRAGGDTPGTADLGIPEVNIDPRTATADDIRRLMNFYRSEGSADVRKNEFTFDRED